MKRTEEEEKKAMEAETTIDKDWFGYNRKHTKRECLNKSGPLLRVRTLWKIRKEQIFRSKRDSS